jgi:site-specific recombinase XerD
MFLSKRSNGIYYLWFVDDGGKKQKVSTGCSLKSEALKFLQSFKEGEKQHKARLTLKTLSEFFSDYREYAKSIHTIKTQQSSVNAFREFIRIVGNLRLDKVGIREIEGFLAQKKAEASEWTARKYYIHLASAFETAKRWNFLVVNPFRKVQKPKTSEVQPLFLTKNEMRSLLDVMKDRQMINLSLTAVYTGMRLGELLNVQWSDINLVTRVIQVRNSATFTTKSRKNRTIPIGEQLCSLLVEMKEAASSELVFHEGGKRLSGDRVSKMFKVSVRCGGLNDKLHFHSLRHTFASWLVQDGVSLYEVQKLLGHSSSAVTQVYSHLQPEGLHSTVNRITIPLN